MGATFRYLALEPSAEMFVGSNNYSRFNARKPHPPIAVHVTGVWEFIPFALTALPSKNMKFYIPRNFPVLWYVNIPYTSFRCTRADEAG